jgi:hypothetical protein
MPDKSRKTVQAKYRKRQAARQRLIERAAAGPQPVQSGGTTQVTGTNVSEAQTTHIVRFSVVDELRTIGLLGGSLVVILIIVSIILRVTNTIS